ncbi:hypothetical protein PT974_06660 [Cladobotryum mycophilum]|uniref:Uncharacterized protein n=1 Tax=Cladobotryum mycophilum TaxID=491253 RepID=A0ABR0SND2_9HYPO
MITVHVYKNGRKVYTWRSNDDGRDPRRGGDRPPNHNTLLALAQGFQNGRQSSGNDNHDGGDVGDDDARNAEQGAARGDGHTETSGDNDGTTPQH